MKLSTMAFANAVALAAAALFSLCARALAIAPAAAYAAFSFLSHLELSGIAYPMSWGVYVGGLVAWVIATWLVAAGFAWVYNRFAGR